MGFPEYYKEEARYATSPSSSSSSGSSSGSSSSGGAAAAAAAETVAPAAAAGVEPDVVLEPGASRAAASGEDLSGTIDLYSGDAGRYGARDAADRRAQWLRLRITNKRSGKATLDVRIPAGEASRGATAGGARWGWPSNQLLSAARMCLLALRVAAWRASLAASRRVPHPRVPHPTQTKKPTNPPAGFLDAVAAYIPAVAGVDLEGLIKQVGWGCLTWGLTWGLAGGRRAG